MDVTVNKVLTKILIIILAILIVGGVFFAKQILFPQRVSSDSSLSGVSPERLEAVEVKAPGQIDSDNRSTLAFLSAGRVAAVNVKAGDKVTRGEVLASLDTTQAAEAVAVAQANYESAQAALNKVLDDIHLFQYGNGGQSNVGTDNETATQKAQRQEAEAARDVAYQSLQSAQKTLSLQTIVAPFDGVVTEVTNVSVGQNVGPTSNSSITVSGRGDLKFVADVSESDIDSVKLGDPVTVSVDALKGETLHGTVSKIADNITTLPDGSQVYKVDVDNGSLNGLTKIGQSGTALISSVGGNVISVPSWLVLSGHFIWVIDGANPELKKVQIGQTIDGKTEIISGLSPSDKLVTNPEVLVEGRYKVI